MRRLSSPNLLWLVFVTLLATTPAMAQPMTPQAEAPESSYTSTVSAGFGGARMAEDWFLSLTLNQVFEFHRVTLSRNLERFEEEQTHALRLRLYAPFNFRVKDNDPQASGAFRTEDWDEVGDYLRLVRVIEYATPYSGIYLRAGELPNVRPGHGSIVFNYTNSVDLDHFQWGVHQNLNTRAGGYELLLDNVARPELMGVRGYVRPSAFSENETLWDRFAVGASIFTDVRAPTQVRDNGAGGYASDEQRNFIVDAHEPTAVLGFDVEMQVVQGSVVSVTPYADANIHLSHGSGWHLGAFSGFQVSPKVVLDFRAEYRLLGGGYLPGYFGPLYEVSRNAYVPTTPGGLAAPKLAWLDASGPERRSGYLLEFGINWADMFLFYFAWEDAAGPNNRTLQARITWQGFEPLRVGAFFVREGFESGSELFDPERSLLALEATAMVNRWLSISIDLSRRWQINEAGQYRTVPDYHGAVGGAFSF